MQINKNYADKILLWGGELAKKQRKRRVNEQAQEEMEIRRIRMPRGNQVLGVVETMLGADRLRVRCSDELVRICRIPGRMRKRVWIRTGDLVLVEPWKVQSDQRGDIIFRYTTTQANWLKRKGYVESISFE